MGVRPGAEAVPGRLLPAGTSLSDPPPVSASSLLALLLGLPETPQGLLCFPSLARAPSLLFAIAWWPVPHLVERGTSPNWASFTVSSE